MYFDADHFYGRILEVEKSANKSFPDYKRGIAKVREMMANEPNIDAVKVVRCRECVNVDYAGCANTTVYCLKNECYMQEDCYCSYGKRKVR